MIAPALSTAERAPVSHELKTVEPFWNDVAMNRKRFEVRVNDRDFRVGDILLLRSTESGAVCCRRVTYMIDGPPFLPPGLCVMGIEPEFVSCLPDLASQTPVGPEPAEADPFEICGDVLDWTSKPKVRCTMVKGEGHGPVHKRISRNGRVTHRWPVLRIGDEKGNG